MKPLNILTTLLVLLVLGSPLTHAETEKTDEKKEPDEMAIQLKITDAMAPSLVRVEYMLRYDKGEPPSGSGFRSRCPNCGSWHGYNESKTVKQVMGMVGPTQDDVRQRAYEIYLARSDRPGDPVADWLQAERELRSQLRT